MPDQGAPPQVEVRGLADYLDVMSRAVFQSGISWRVVDAKWPGTREALLGFDPARVAAIGDAEIDALVQDTRVIRHRRKIEAVVANAGRLIEIDAAHGGFRAYLRSHADFDALVADLRRQFAFLGETGCYYFLYVVGEPVPPHHEWEARRAAPRRRRSRPRDDASR